MEKHKLTGPPPFLWGPPPDRCANAAARLVRRFAYRPPRLCVLGVRYQRAPPAILVGALASPPRGTFRAARGATGYITARIVAPCYSGR